MAKDKYKVDKTKPPKPIQLKDASGPPIHDLADERNYELLDMLFKRKENDPLGKEGLDPNYVYQLMDTDAPSVSARGQYANPGADMVTYLEGIKEYGEDYKKHGPREFYKDKDKGAEREVKKDDVITMYDQWNTPQGIDVLLHEARHRSIGTHPKAKALVQESSLSEEAFVRALDVMYADPLTSAAGLNYLEKALRQNGVSEDLMDDMIDTVLNMAKELETKILKEIN